MHGELAVARSFAVHLVKEKQHRPAFDLPARNTYHSSIQGDGAHVVSILLVVFLIHHLEKLGFTSESIFITQSQTSARFSCMGQGKRKSHGIYREFECMRLRSLLDNSTPVYVIGASNLDVPGALRSRKSRRTLGLVRSRPECRAGHSRGGDGPTRRQAHPAGRGLRCPTRREIEGAFMRIAMY